MSYFAPIRRTWAGLLLLLVLGAAVTLFLVERGSARASTTEGAGEEAISYTKPTGPELTPEGAAEAALKAIGPNTVTTGNGNQAITMRVAHGSFGQLKPILNGQDTGGPTATGTGRCFPGLPCRPSEVEHMEQLEREMNEATAYLIEMTGTTFTVAGNLLPPGAQSPAGKVESVIVDAHTGFMKSQTVNGPTLDMRSLGTLTTLSATISSTGAIVAKAGKVKKVRTGTIIGHVRGSKVAGLQVTLSTIGHQPMSSLIVGWATIGIKGNFKIKNVQPGTYGIGARRGGCNGKHVKVRAGHFTKVTLSCP
jgi:hypothetical protein